MCEGSGMQNYTCFLEHIGTYDKLGKRSVFMKPNADDLETNQREHVAWLFNVSVLKNNVQAMDISSNASKKSFFMIDLHKVLEPIGGLRESCTFILPIPRIESFCSVLRLPYQSF